MEALSPDFNPQSVTFNNVYTPSGFAGEKVLAELVQLVGGPGF